MRLKIIGNQRLVEKVNRVIERNFPHIKPINCIYDVYTEATPMAKTKKNECDAILFSGPSPYFVSKKFIDPNIITDYLPRSTHSLLFAFLLAEKQSLTINHISIDSYTEKEVYTVYDELDIPLEHTQVHFIERETMNLDFDRLIREHEQCYRKNKVSCCMTALRSVWSALSAHNIPCIYIEPTYEIIMETLHKLELSYIFNFTQRNSLVVMQIRIDEPKEYSILHQNEYKNIMDKAKTLTFIYEFAERINAAILEAKDESYLLFVPEDTFSAKTNDLKNIDLLSQIRNNTYSTVSLGIGYGNTIREAHEGARRAFFQAVKSGGDRAFVANEGLFIYPFTCLGNKPNLQTQVENTIDAAANAAGLSANIIYQIVALTDEIGKKTFTAKELASLLGLNQRRMNRIIERLESGGFCKIVGNRMVSPTGRPSRIIEFNNL